MKPGIVILLLVWALALPAAASQSATYVIGMPCLTVSECRSPEVEALMREAYRRIGAQVEFKYLPQLRDIQETEDGLIDASLARTKSAIEKHSGLVVVNTPLAEEALVAFTVRKGIPSNSWEELQSLSVGVILGAVTATAQCSEHGIKPHFVKNMAQAFAMLSHARLDVVVANHKLGLFSANSLGIRVYHSQPLHSEALYHVLNRKHADIAPLLSAAFEEMRDDGTTRRLLGDWGVFLPDE